MNKYGKISLVSGTVLMALVVCFGAFGAHILKAQLTTKAFETYQTGVTYHSIHALALILLGLIERTLDKNMKTARVLVLCGILFFSFNCYFYALTQMKIFAMIVPIGGFFFIGFWTFLAKEIYQSYL